MARRNVVEAVIERALKSSSLYERTRSAAQGLVNRIKEDYLAISVGKASVDMLRGVIDGLGREPSLCLLIKPRNVRLSSAPCSNAEVIEGSHPVPDEGSIKAGDEALRVAAEASRAGMPLVVAVSGGGSAMMERPIEGISLDDLSALNKVLLSSGASISEINVIRRHISKVKGGKLLRAAKGARTYGLYASDVPGDFLEDIASGPTAPDPTTFRDALDILNRYKLVNDIPPSVLKVLRDGERGLVEETVKPGSPELELAENLIVATNYDVVSDVAALLEEMGYNTIVLTSAAQGESREVGKFLASIALDVMRKGVPVRPPAAIVLGGETAVTVRGRGLGGRNQELALSWALELRRLGIRSDRATLVALATDGVDGPTDAAGAVVTPALVDLMYNAGVNPAEELINNDSYRALASVNALIKTGPTGSNLNNVIVVLVDDHESKRQPDL